MSTPLPSPVIAIHGGAGTLTRNMMTTDQEAAYRATLAASLLAGHTCLAAGGSALDAVCAAVQVMEDSPLMLSVGHTGARVVSSSEATPITSTWTL